MELGTASRLPDWAMVDGGIIESWQSVEPRRGRWWTTSSTTRPSDDLVIHGASWDSDRLVAG
jgi:hypothetical protein